MIAIRVISWSLVVIGLVMLGFGLQAYRERQQFLADARPAEGTVTEVIRRMTAGSGKRSSSTQYVYRVRYKTAGGQDVEFVTEDAESSPWLKVGDAVQILYLPREPEKAVFDSFAWIWFKSGLLFVLGGCALAVGLCNLWISARPAKRGRAEAQVGEIWRALRAGRLTRDSEYQPILIAFTFVGFPLLAATLLVVLFAGLVWKVLFAGTLGFAVFSAVRARRGVARENLALRQAQGERSSRSKR